MRVSGIRIPGIYVYGRFGAALPLLLGVCVFDPSLLEARYSGVIPPLLFEGSLSACEFGDSQFRRECGRNYRASMLVPSRTENVVYDRAFFFAWVLKVPRNCSGFSVASICPLLPLWGSGCRGGGIQYRCRMGESVLFFRHGQAPKNFGVPTFWPPAAVDGLSIPPLMHGYIGCLLYR